ncbi:heme o synthase [Candidatus Saccharibacteria bacterium]|nr:heme o synthase [Candidatus Saccharibacteria bacterium]
MKASIPISQLKQYYALTKPGIIYGNLITAGAGFFLASRGHVSMGRLLVTLLGLGLVIASACVFNNYIDKDIDEQMARTKRRALVTKAISDQSALIYGSGLGIAGGLVLAIWVNWLALIVSAAGWLVYIFLYTLSKRRTVYSTLIGSVSGSTPPVVGYCAAANHLDGGALLLFLALTFWQMPHFYAIAIRRYKDYKAAGLPVLPVQYGITAAKRQIVGYIIGFIVVVSLLKIYGYTGYTFLVVVEAISLAWLRLALKGFEAGNDQKWAKGVFLFSLVVTLVFSFMLSVDAWLP